MTRDLRLGLDLILVLVLRTVGRHETLELVLNVVVHVLVRVFAFLTPDTILVVVLVDGPSAAVGGGLIVVVIVFVAIG